MNEKEFNKIVANVKRELKKQVKDREVSFKFNKGYFLFSGFITLEEGIVYFSIRDPRNFDDWEERVLVRSAKNTKDYTGGNNHYAPLEDVIKKADEIIRREKAYDQKDIQRSN